MNILPYATNANALNFSGKYSAEYICSKLCGGACCDHGTPMNVRLKAEAEKLFARTVPTAEEAPAAPARLNLHNWLCLDGNPRLNFINNKSKIYLDQLFRETDPAKRAAIMKELEKINQELEEVCGDVECFTPITNPHFAENPQAAIYPIEPNVCIFKDHGNTNKCTIYHGIEKEDGTVIPRPQACLDVGGEQLPCPWLNPEKYPESVRKTRAMFARRGYNVPIETCQQHVAEQFNLNETFMEKIWKPFLEESGLLG